MKVTGPVKIELAATIVLYTPKKDGLLGFIVDYWKLNVVTERKSYPYPEWTSVTIQSKAH